jgi:hypothetical protein
MDSEQKKIIHGTNVDLSEANPISMIYNYKKNQAKLIFNNGLGNQIVTRSFDSVFNVLNTQVLRLQNDIILPNGCIYKDTLDNGIEAYLMEEQAGIRTFRLSNTEAVYKLVGKMYDKFMAKTRVLEKNKMPEGEEERIIKLIKLRKAYIQQQKIRTASLTREELISHYKLFFRVFFPYSYILIKLILVKTVMFVQANFL